VTNVESEQVTSIFSPKELASLDRSKVPHHIAIIPDGNRRWAKKQFKDIIFGYSHGAENLITIVQAARELGIKVLTSWGFSTENWKRPKEETDTLMQMMEKYLIENLPKLLANSIRFNVIGRLENLPPSLQKVIEETKAATEGCCELDLVFALDYGGRDELCRAIKKIATDCCQKKITPDDLNEEIIGRYLDTWRWPDPDLIIRTSGERRLSNFLLWQSSYTEFFIEEAMWPSFSPKHLLSAILDFQARDRRKGGGGFV
jgi:undecaprenyl diphosphate synthase